MLFCEGGEVDEAPSGTPEQGELFPDPLIGSGFDGLPDQLVGFRGPTACQVVGITYRQLDYWARTGLVEPSVRPRGSRPGDPCGELRHRFQREVCLMSVRRVALLTAGGFAPCLSSAVGGLIERYTEIAPDVDTSGAM